MRPSWPSGLSEDRQDLMAAFLDDLRDWIDVHSTEDSYHTGWEAAKALNTHVVNLNEASLLVGVRIRHLLLTGGSRDSVPWRELDVQIRPIPFPVTLAKLPTDTSSSPNRAVNHLEHCRRQAPTARAGRSPAPDTARMPAHARKSFSGLKRKPLTQPSG
jgi:hypothetical protein